MQIAGDRAVIMQSPQPRIEIGQISHGARAASVPRPHGDCTVAVWSSCIFGYSGTKRVQLLIFIEMALQTCKTKYSMRQRHQLTQTLTLRKPAVWS